MIRLTFVSEYQHSEPREFDTDDVGEALAELAQRSLGSGVNAGPTPWIVAFIVERDGERMTPHEVAGAFRSIASKERVWADRDAAPTGEKQEQSNRGSTGT